ncbi:AAA family ATPase [bacterium]|nr:AAA family ATPase [bacterium]
MRIDFIKLKNFRPYVDEKISFSSDEKKKNFTIIQGANGTGKSSLLNAVTWCLYDEEIHLTKGLKGLPLCNTDVFDNLKKKQILDVEVEIQMIDEEGKKHNIIRTLKYRKGEDDKEEMIPDPSSRERDGSTFQYFREEGGQSNKLHEPRFFLEQIMPENIKEYFFFDGGQLNQYFKEASGERIKKAVFDVSQITVMEKLIDRLIKKKRDLIRDSDDLGPEIEELKEEIEVRQKSLDAYKENLRKKKWDKEEATKLEREKSEELRQYPDSADFENKRLKIGEQIEKIDDDVKFLKDEKLKRLLKISNPIIARDALINAKKIVDKGINEGKYPPDAKKDFIEPLLKKNICICGRDLSDPKCRKRIEDLLERISTDSDICSEIIGMQDNLRQMIDQIGSFDEEQVELSRKIRDFENNRDTLIKEQEVLLKKIGSSPIEKVKRLKQQLENAKKTKDDLIYEIGKMETQIDIEGKNIDRITKNLTDAVNKQDKYNVISKILAFLDKSIDYAKQIKDEIMQEVRERIQEKTKEQFFNLIWNKESFQDVLIDSEYNISVIHHSGREGIGTLSDGQRQVLALSFMAALKQVSGFNTPIMIDTPLGIISKEPKNNIAKKLPNYLEGTQVTMLVTEEEYTPEVRSLLKCRVQKEFRIILESPTIAKVIKYDNQ